MECAQPSEAATGDRGRLEFCGNATTRTVETLRAQLVDALQQHDALELDCTQLDAVDASFVQLLLSARKSAERQGKMLALARPAAGALLDALMRGGFVSSRGSPSSHDAGFWHKDAPTMKRPS